MEAMIVILERHPTLQFAQDRHGRTPLHTAARTGNVEAVELLLTKYIDQTRVIIHIYIYIYMHTYVYKQTSAHTGMMGKWGNQHRLLKFVNRLWYSYIEWSKRCLFVTSGDGDYFADKYHLNHHWAWGMNEQLHLHRTMDVITDPFPDFS